MRRADRLFQVIQLLRRRNVVTAAWLATELEVSERTVYRDVRDLVMSGVPIEGEAGVGYMLRRGFDLPPLMFTEAEIEAMALGARIVTSWGDASLAKAAGEALARVESVLPDRLRSRLNETRLFAPGFHVPRGVMRSLEDRMQAVEQKVRGAADTTRARTAPENPMVTSMRAAVTKAEEQLAKAEAAGDQRRLEEAQANLATRREWLAEAEKSASRR